MLFVNFLVIQRMRLDVLSLLTDLDRFLYLEAFYITCLWRWLMTTPGSISYASLKRLGYLLLFSQRAKFISRHKVKPIRLIVDSHVPHNHNAHYAPISHPSCANGPTSCHTVRGSGRSSFARPAL